MWGNMENKEIIEKIKEYLLRPEIRKYSLTERGIWRIYGGTENGQGDRYDIGVHEGTFLDALTTLVTHMAYKAKWRFNLENKQNGVIIKYTIPLLKPTNITPQDIEGD